MRKRLVTLLVLFCAPSSVFAQDANVRMRVTHDGAPVRQARVAFGEGGALTDSLGVAAFRVAAGRHALRVESFGFAAFSDTVDVRADTTVVVELEEEAVEGEEIIVSSTRGERRIQDEPVKVEVVTREEVEEKLLMTPGS